QTLCDGVRAQVYQLIDQPQAVDPDALEKQWRAAVDEQAQALAASLSEAAATVRKELSAFIAKTVALVPSAETVNATVKGRCDALKEGVKNLLAEIGTALDADGQLAEIRGWLERQRDHAAQEIDAALQGGVRAARQVLGAVESKGDDVLKLVRAFGKPPEV